MRPIAKDTSVVYRSVGRDLSLTIVSPAKMPEPNEMPFEMWTHGVG